VPITKRTQTIGALQDATAIAKLSYFASLAPRTILLLWYQLAQVVLEKDVCFSFKIISKLTLDIN